MKVILKQDDIDYVNGEKYIGIAIFPFDENVDLENDEALDQVLSNTDCINRIYAKGEQNAWEETRIFCEKEQYHIICEI